MNEIEKQLKNAITPTPKRELITSDIISFDRDFFGELTEVTLEFLEKYMYDILSLGAKANLQLGKKFQEVADELKKQGSPEGVYTKYIQYLGYNERTILRYRNRWNLYNSVTNSNSKGIISIIPMKYVEVMLEEKDKYMDILEKGTSIEEIRSMIDDKNIIAPKFDSVPLEIEPGFFKDKIFSLSVKAEELEAKLTNEEKEKLNRLLNQLEKILNK